jgi:hypothetical protein
VVPEVRFVVHGVGAAVAESHRADALMSAAMRSALVSIQSRMKRSAKARASGAPRWNHRGKGVYGTSVTVSGPVHSPRGGGPGVFTGQLRKGIGTKKPKLEGPATWVGGIGVGGRRIPANNLKKGRLEARFPFMAPAVASVSPKVDEITAAAVTKAVVKWRA